MGTKHQNPHIVVAHLDDGVRVTDHPSKAAAHRAGMTHRRNGVVAFVYSADFAAKFGLDPRKKEARDASAH